MKDGISAINNRHSCNIPAGVMVSRRFPVALSCPGRCMGILYAGGKSGVSPFGFTAGFWQCLWHSFGTPEIDRNRMKSYIERRGGITEIWPGYTKLMKESRQILSENYRGNSGLPDETVSVKIISCINGLDFP